MDTLPFGRRRGFFKFPAAAAAAAADAGSIDLRRFAEGMGKDDSVVRRFFGVIDELELMVVVLLWIVDTR